jgi:hypothetical protein
VQLLDLHAHLNTQLGIEVGQRLIEQKQQGVAHQGSAHGDALALAAGELARLRDRARRRSAAVWQPAPPPHRACAWHVRHSMPKVMFWRTVIDGIERVGLEHHGDVAIFGATSSTTRPPISTVPELCCSRPAMMLSKRRLAATGWPDQHGELARADLEADSLSTSVAPNLL